MPWKHRFPLILAIAGAMALTGCGDRVTAPAALSVGDQNRTIAAPSRPTESARWNEVARNLSQKYGPPQQVGLRGLTYLSLAQYNAAVAALRGNARPSVRGAVAGASVTVLSWLYPAEVGYLESLITIPGPSDVAAYNAGLGIGRALGASVVASAANDHFNLVWTGTVPTGPGYCSVWRSHRLRRSARSSVKCVLSHQRVPVPPAAAARLRLASVSRGPRRGQALLRHPDTGAGPARQILGPAGRLQADPSLCQPARRRTDRQVWQIGTRRCPHFRAHQPSSHGRLHCLSRRQVHLLAAPALDGRPTDHPVGRVA